MNFTYDPYATQKVVSCSVVGFENIVLPVVYSSLLFFIFLYFVWRYNEEDKLSKYASMLGLCISFMFWCFFVFFV